MTYSIDKLCAAVGNGDIKTIKKCLKAGININQKDTTNPHYVPLEWLTSTPSKSARKVLKVLLRNGANLLLDDGRVLLDLLKCKHSSILIEDILAWIKTNNEKKDKPLSDIKLTDREGIQYPILFFFIKYGNYKAVLALLEMLEVEKEYLDWKHENKTPIFWALDNRNTDLVFYFLEQGANPNATNDNNTSILQKLIRTLDSTSIDEFITNYKPNVAHKNDSVESCLHTAAREGDFETLDILLKNKSLDVNLQNVRGNTPLLIALGSLLSLQGELGFSEDSDSEMEPESEMEDDGICDPAFSREYKDHKMTIKKLLSVGVMVNVKNSESKTALDYVNELTHLKSLKRSILRHSKIESLAEDFKKIYDTIQKKSSEEAQLLDPVFNFIKLKYEHNADSTVDIKDAIGNMEGILKNLREKKYLRYDQVNIYEIVTALINDKSEFKLHIQARIENRNKKEVLTNNDFYYTFYDEKLYKLAKKGNKTIYQLMTTLVYEAIRHPWTDATCQLHHNLICKLNPEYAKFTLDDYVKKIREIEESEETYFGENLSENSDTDEEKAYQQLSHRKKSLSQSSSKTLFSRSQAGVLTVKNKDSKGKNSLTKRVDPFTLYNREERQHIYRDQLTDQVQRDLEKLNMLAITQSLDEETIKTINTTFYIAQYRGTSYRIDQGNQLNRILHRKSKEEKQPIFSRAVLETAGYSSFYDYYEKKLESKEKQNEINNTLLIVAEQLQDQLLQLASSGPVHVNLIGDTYEFDNALHALQDLYTKSYNKFHKYLKDFSSQFLKLSGNKGKPIPAFCFNTLEQTIAHSIGNAFNPFVSTSDIPEHAIRYAYNDKYYKDQKEIRLRPRWRKDGLCERPYSGKIYISLHDPLELYTKSHHVVSLNTQTKIRIDNQTVSERETSFFGYIPPGKVVSQHVAKFPSFHGKYKDIYFEKYGLTKELYKKFRQTIRTTKPHSKKRKQVVRLLTAHLVSYQEVCLIEEAQIAASNAGGTLIYRNEHGGFSLIPCQAKEISHTLDKKRKQAIEATNEQASKKRKLKKNGSHKSEGFLSTLLTDYNIIPAKEGTNSLICSMAVMLKVPVEDLNKFVIKINKPISNSKFFTRVKPQSVTEYFTHQHALVKLIADHYQTNIHIHNPEFTATLITVNSATSTKNEIHIYYAGGQKFAALCRKGDSLPAALPDNPNSQKIPSSTPPSASAEKSPEGDKEKKSSGVNGSLFKPPRKPAITPPSSKPRLKMGKFRGEDFYFSRIATSGKDSKGRSGSCGFNALKTTRDDVLKILNANIDNPSLRRSIGLQIDSDYQTSTLTLNSKFINEIKTHKDKYDALEQKRADTISRLKVICQQDISDFNLDIEISSNPDIGALIIAFTEIGKREKEIKELLDIQEIHLKEQNEFENILSSKNFVADYIKKNINGDWLGAHIAVAWAKLTNRTLRIWRHKDEKQNSNELLLYNGLYNISSTDQSPIDMLHTWGETHYERLQRQQSPELEQATGLAAMQLS